MCKMDNLTKEQQELVTEIMERESPQRKVDEMFAKARAEMEADED